MDFPKRMEDSIDPPDVSGEKKRKMLARVRNSLLILDGSDGEKTERILEAMQKADRKFFAGMKEYVYADSALPAGFGQTISQPSTVARMFYLADILPGNHVLEIGSGSGWNASIAAFLAYPGRITSIETIRELHEKAAENARNLKESLNQGEGKKLDNLEFVNENVFEKGKAWKKRYDRIIITAGIAAGDDHKISEIAKKLLKDGGILVCPHIRGPLITMKKRNGEIVKEYSRELYVFVPLVD